MSCADPEILSAHPKIKTLQELSELRAEWSERRETVVWTNGCFDLLHVGHIRSLHDAKALGDILIVGVNSDAGVRAIKGDARPIVNQSHRAEMIAALEMVDYVTIFDEPTPIAALARLRPDIHCKSAEYADGAKPMPERDIVLGYGGRIGILPVHNVSSTTEIIERIARCRS
jgi:rfaE bifunctional protein nucleotidyltransferase chain/domain